MPKKNNILIIITILCLLTGIAVAQEQMTTYQVTASFNADTEELRGGVTIIPGAGFSDDLLLVKIAFSQEYKLSISEVIVNGQKTEIMQSGGQLALDLSSISEGVRPQIKIKFYLEQVPQMGGIYFFSNSATDKQFSWFPQMITEKREPAQYSLDVTISGPGAVAVPRVYRGQSNSAGEEKHHLEGIGLSAPSFIYSPIFVEKRVAVGGCNLGLFMREGSQLWQEKSLNYLSEVYSYYKEKTPGFSFARLDVVLTGEEAPDSGGFAGIVLMKDETEAMSENFGGVFAANYLRWNSSLVLSSFFWESIIDQGNYVPWLSRGISLYWAERFSNNALLGGPAFENIRQFYLNSASAGRNTVLNQEVSQAEKSGADVENVLAMSKGLWVTRILYNRIGRNSFNEFLSLLSLEKGKVISNRRIRELAEKASGKNLKEFFEAWINGNTTLDYGITRINNGSDKVELLLTSKGSAREQVTVQVSYQDGSVESKEVTISEKEYLLKLGSGKKVARVRVDPEALLPDINRADNMKSLHGSRRIEQLYSVDSVFDIGDITLVSQPEKTERSREAGFNLMVTNKKEETAYLGLWLTLRFPGGRNRGITRMLLELAPGEEKTITAPLKFPMKGIGLAYLTAEFYKVSGEETYGKISKKTKPSLRNYYVFAIDQ